MSDLRAQAADWDEFRRLQDAQQRRYERAGVGGGRAEHDEYFGHGEYAGHGTEHQLTSRDWIKQSRQPSQDDLPPHEREWHRGYELGQDHGQNVDRADFAEMDREHAHSPHPEHFADGYGVGLNNNVPYGQSRVARYAVLLGFGDMPDNAPGVQKLARVIAEDMPRIVKLSHDSGDPEVVFHCFGGETRYITREGIKTFAETAGTIQWVLTGSTDDPHGGFWMEAPVKELGEQELWEVTLKRNRRTKVIRATSGHRWLVRRPDRVVTTQDLKPGQRLAHLRARQFDLAPDREGIRMGFVYGDGTILQRTAGTYGAVTLWGEKRQLAKYFDEIAVQSYATCTENGVEGLRYTSGMKGYTKIVPTLYEPPEYLLGWLMGLFAADGSVTPAGQVSLSSASLETLERVRDIATVLGIGTYEPHTKMRTGYGSTPTAIHAMDFMAEDLRPEFFLRDDQRARADHERPARIGWTVESVRPTGKVEPVYCVRAHGTDVFVLEDNLLTGNCPFCGSGRVIARSDGTIECGFDKACFTVQVQPRFPAFPQTINGVPMQVPGMGPQWPGDDDEAMVAQQQAQGTPVDEDDPDADGDDDANPFADDDADAEQEPTDSGGGGNPFAKKSFRTAHGDGVPLDSFLRHVALEAARDRSTMLTRLKES